MPRQVLIPLTLFKEVFSSVNKQGDVITGVLKTKKGDSKLVACKIQDVKSKAKSPKSRLE